MNCRASRGDVAITSFWNTNLPTFYKTYAEHDVRGRTETESRPPDGAGRNAGNTNGSEQTSIATVDHVERSFRKKANRRGTLRRGRRRVRHTWHQQQQVTTTTHRRPGMLGIHSKPAVNRRADRYRPTGPQSRRACQGDDLYPSKNLR